MLATSCQWLWFELMVGRIRPSQAGYISVIDYGANWQRYSLSPRDWVLSVFSFVCSRDLQPRILAASQSFAPSMASSPRSTIFYSTRLSTLLLNNSLRIVQVCNLECALATLPIDYTLISSTIMRSQISHSRREGVCKGEVGRGEGEYAFLTSITETFDFRPLPEKSNGWREEVKEACAVNSPLGRNQSCCRMLISLASNLVLESSAWANVTRTQNQSSLIH